VKTDSIDLTLVVSPVLKDMLTDWEAGIKEKVGAGKIMVSSKPPTEKFLYRKEERVKDEEFTVAFDKV